MPAVGAVVVAEEGVAHVRALAHDRAAVPKLHEGPGGEPLGDRYHPVVDGLGVYVLQLVYARHVLQGRRQLVAAPLEDLLELRDVRVAHVAEVGLCGFLEIGIFGRDDVHVALAHAHVLAHEALDHRRVLAGRKLLAIRAVLLVAPLGILAVLGPPVRLSRLRHLHAPFVGFM